MAVAPSFSDLVAQFVATAQSYRPKLRFLPGDTALAQAHGAVAMSDAAIRYAAQKFKATFFDGAKGAELTTLVADRTGVQRSEATAAEVTLTFERLVAGPAGTILEDSTVATPPGPNGEQVFFDTDADLVWSLNETGTKTVGATCTVVGAVGNVEDGELTVIVDDPPFDPGAFTVTNAARAAGGNAEEGDPDLRQRGRNFWKTLRRGTKAALAQGARVVAAIRVATVSVSDAGIVTVKVSDADGNSTLQMQADAATELDNWQCAGDLVQVTGNTPLVTNVAAVLTVKDGFAVASRSADFIAAVEARMRLLGAGEVFYLDMAAHAIISVEPGYVLAVDFPFQDDVTPAAGQVVRPGTVTMTQA